MSERRPTIPPELADWAARVAPLELIERKFHITDKADTMVGLFDGSHQEWLDRCDRAVAEARARLGLDGAVLTYPSNHSATVPHPSTSGTNEAPEVWQGPVPQPCLAATPDILGAFAAEIRACGVVGEDRLAKVTYLALTSRLLERPVSVAVKGPSAAGKSYVTETVLRYFPDTAFKALTGMSEHALVYLDEPLSHRFLVIYEAAGMAGELASYLVRSLLSEGRVEYVTVVKTKDGPAPKKLVIEGPTGLLVTTTAISLHPENETRLLSVPASDSADQTKAVLQALASEAQAEQRPVDEWHQLQRWLEDGPTGVTVPFARELAELVPPVAVRLRRDFGTVLNLTRAHALLHRASRETDADGRIVAIVADYAAARELIADLVADQVGATVSPSVSEAVQAVGRLHAEREKPVTLRDLAAALDLDKSPAARRARQAIQRGYLVNLEERRGKPARYVPGEPLPADLEVLPRPETLGCGSVAAQPEGIDATTTVAVVRDCGTGLCHTAEAPSEAENEQCGSVAAPPGGMKATAADEPPGDETPDDDHDADPAIPFVAGSTLEKAARIAVDVGAVSRALLERRLDLYEAEACQVLDHLEALGIVAAGNGRARSVLVDDEGLERLLE
ncbi:MAG: hypothetical protein QM323_11165, partial [Acidobacteriota bacterium]|nr:hypothetical protein [Acidobacteriota bacterium]